MEFLASEGVRTAPTKGTTMHIRIVTFALAGPSDEYVRLAGDIAPEFRSWPGLLAKWWLGDAASGTYGGVYLFATREDADASRQTELFRGMHGNPAFRDVTVREYHLLDGPTAVTAPVWQEAG
jgi:Putative mono-oxygenase ydhR